MYRRMSLLAVFLLLLSVPVFAEELSQQVTRLVEANDAEGLRALGDEAVTAMVWLYELSEEPERTHIANLFSKMGVRSDLAERALLRDFLSPNLELRLAVQNALGRVSSNPMVVETLLYTLENDRNPLVRDKAASALAYDQIHLNEQEKVRIYEGLIEALSNPEAQIRAVSIQALSILTGQTKGFHALYPEDRRERSIAMWQHWLEERRTKL
ncbi:MAG TPA: HEAT repeat domain-containing protein [Thermoanaerobaculia bacterium]|nr:HEAT repeat domain-containing protein [Thermoanaerobaculia bacterium]